MLAPVTKIITKLREKGIASRNPDKLKARYVPKFLPLEVTDIINRYNSIVRGYLNYYSFVDNRTRLAKIHWIIKESLRKTICRKLDINRQELLKNFGKKIVGTNTRGKKKKTVSYFNPKFNRTPMKFMNKDISWNPLGSLDWSVSSRDSFDTQCAVCSSPENLEMHHIKHIKTINPKLSEFDAAVARMNRKQVPLCVVCHTKVHKGEYVGDSLKSIKWRK